VLSVPPIQLGAPSCANGGPNRGTYSRHIIGYLSGVTAALVGPLPTFVSTVQHHGDRPLGHLIRTDVQRLPKLQKDKGTGHWAVPSLTLW
jgi:hypothetical protein